MSLRRAMINSNNTEIDFLPEPPLGDVVVCGDEERLPGPCDEDLLEEDLGHVERGDDGGQPCKLQHQVQVLAHRATRLLTGNLMVFQQFLLTTYPTLHGENRERFNNFTVYQIRICN